MTVNISIEVRMTSSRLPGKVLKPIKGLPSLEIMIHRIKKAKNIDNIIVATTTNKEDDVIVSWCQKNGISYFRGSEHNVYERILNAHIHYNTDIIIELTGDCPLMDYAVIDKCLSIYLNNDYDYVRTSSNYPLGMGIAIFSLKTLQSVSINRNLEYQDMEHVSPYLYTSGLYKCFDVESSEDETAPWLSVTLDTIEDLKVITNVCDNFDTFDFSLKDIVSFAKNNPSLVSENQDMHRKGLA